MDRTEINQRSGTVILLAMSQPYLEVVILGGPIMVAEVYSYSSYSDLCSRPAPDFDAIKLKSQCASEGSSTIGGGGICCDERKRDDEERDH